MVSVPVVTDDTGATTPTKGRGRSESGDELMSNQPIDATLRMGGDELLDNMVSLVHLCWQA